MRRARKVRLASELGGKRSSRTEKVFSLKRKGVQVEAKCCSVCGEMNVQLRAESVFTLVRNTHLLPILNRHRSFFLDVSQFEPKRLKAARWRIK